MKMLIPPDRFAVLRSREVVPLECIACGKTFHAAKHHVQVAMKNAGTAKSGRHTMESCSRKCAYALVSRRANTITCAECGASKRRPPSETTSAGRAFCSRRCAMVYRNRAKDLGKTNSSRGEAHLLALIAGDFPNLVVSANARDVLPSGLEIDIFLPDLRLAIELNGPVHYFPIYGADKLARVRSLDMQKQVEIHAAGIDLIVIDTSHCRGGKRTTDFLDRHYASHIKPLLWP